MNEQPCIRYEPATREHRARGCIIRGRHQPSCNDDACRGCLPRLATDGHLCELCYARTISALSNLPLQWALLGDNLARGSAAGNARVSGTQEPPAAMNLAVAQHRLEIERQLGYWIGYQAEAAHTHRPANYRHPPTACGWLYRRITWASEQVWSGNYAHDLIDLSGKARSLLSPNRRRTIPIGPCPENECAGTLHGPAERDQADKLPHEITCTANPEHTWPESRWLLLGSILNGRTA